MDCGDGRLCRQHRSPAIQVSVPGGCDRGVQGRGLALGGGLGTAGRESTVTPVETLRAAGERGEGVGDAGMGSPGGGASVGRLGRDDDVSVGDGDVEDGGSRGEADCGGAGDDEMVGATGGAREMSP